MQKLLERDTYIPTDAPQVCSSVTTDLNRVQRLSDSSLKTFDNNSEVDCSQHTGSSDLRVQNIMYALNKNVGDESPPVFQQTIEPTGSYKKQKIRR